MPATEDEGQNHVFSCALRALDQIGFAGRFQRALFFDALLARDRANSIVSTPLSSVIPKAEAPGVERFWADSFHGRYPLDPGCKRIS
jgi:hypothetical protein